MGALRDFVARDPRTDAPAVVNFPVREDNPYRIDVAATQGADRPPSARAHHLRTQHGAASRAGRRDQALSHRAGHRRRRPLRHGARARPGRPALPGALRGGRRPRHRLDPQDLLRHPARRGRQPLRRARAALRAVGGPAPPRLPRLGLQPSPGHYGRPALCHLRDARLSRRLPAPVIANAKAFARALARGGPRRAGRPGGRLHRDPPGRPQGGVRPRPRDGGAPRGEQHRLQLPGPARRRGLHRRRRAAPGRGRDDALRHGARRLRRARRADRRRRPARRARGEPGQRPAAALRRAALLLRRRAARRRAREAGELRRRRAAEREPAQRAAGRNRVEGEL